MPSKDHNRGVVESAVLGFEPSEPVLLEAQALDQELVLPQRSWDALLRAIDSFVTHYPSVLLHAFPAARALGEACLKGGLEGPSLIVRAQAGALLIRLLGGLLEEVHREGPGRIPAQVPDGIKALLSRMTQESWTTLEQAHLIPGLLAVGKKLLLVGEEGNPPALWYSALGVLTGLLLGSFRFRIQGEPRYEGAWDGGGEFEELEVSRLTLVRGERLDADLDWLRSLEQRLLADPHTVVDVFLELSAFSHRDDREGAWQEWMRALAARAARGGIGTASLRKLCEAMARWICATGDRGFLTRLGAALDEQIEAVASALGQTGFRVALETIGQAIVTRLEQEAARGEIDLALEHLRAVAARISSRLMNAADPAILARAQQLALLGRTGPVVGYAVSCEDVIFRLRCALDFPGAAEPLLLSTLAGLSLEEGVLLQSACRPGQTSVAEALCELIRAPWSAQLRFLSRAVLKNAPLSPFHLGGPTVRAHLLALDPEGQPDSYLHDLKERILSHTGPKNLEAIEGVLGYWRSADSACLTGIATPESLNALPTRSREHLADIQRLLAQLSQRVSGVEEGKVDWLASLPDSFYDVTTLNKIIGFPGCSARALSMLVHLLHVYRALTKRVQSWGKGSFVADRSNPDLLMLCGHLLQQRREWTARLGAADRELMGPLQCFECFSQEIRSWQDAEQVLEELVHRVAGDLPLEMEQIVALLALLVDHALESGVGGASLGDLARRLSGEPAPLGEEVAAIARRIQEAIRAERQRLTEGLRPHVLDSARRLQNNPLARPAELVRSIFEAHPRGEVEPLAEVFLEVLVNDLLAADGGLLLLEDLVGRLLPDQQTQES